jgi:hypothetical protein
LDNHNIEALPDKPSDVLLKAREKYLSKNPMSMEEIDEEIERCRNERIGQSQQKVNIDNTKIAPAKLRVRYIVNITSPTQLQDGTTHDSNEIIHHIYM